MKDAEGCLALLKKAWCMPRHGVMGDPELPDRGFFELVSEAVGVPVPVLMDAYMDSGRVARGRR